MMMMMMLVDKESAMMTMGVMTMMMVGEVGGDRALFLR